jgi:4-amino-4-deoxy-L-arabinose transferase-like glycosyltransferase
MMWFNPLYGIFFHAVYSSVQRIKQRREMVSASAGLVVLVISIPILLGNGGPIVQIAVGLLDAYILLRFKTALE